MSDSLGFWIASTVIVALAGPLIAVLAALLERTGPIRIRHWAEEAGGKLEALYEESLRFEAFGFLLSGAARLLPVAFFGLLWKTLAIASVGGAPLLAAIVVVVGAVGVEIACRILSARDPERALRRLTPLYRLMYFVLNPFVSMVRRLLRPNLVERREEDGEPEASEGEIEAFLTVGTEEGILEPGEQEMVKGIVDLGETPVRSVMTPRPDVVCASIDDDVDTLAALFLESNHSRIPLYRDSIDHVVGVLHIRDLLRGLRAPVLPAISEIANEPFLVPETRPLDDLLEQFQRLHQQMAIVVDEFGGTSGLVTVEDLVEEIVGEIADEHEQPVADREELSEGVWRLSGRSQPDIVTEIFDVAMDEVVEDTIGGLVFSLLGHVPEGGETTESRGLQFTVGEVEGRRIHSVVVTRIVEPDESIEDTE